MRAFALKKLQVLSHYFCSNLHNIRKTSFSWNPILLSRKLHDATPVEKLHDDASMRQEKLTVERKRSWISREDTIDEQKRFQFLLENLGLTTLVRMIHFHGPSIGFMGFNRLVKLLIEKARSTGDKRILLEQLNLIRHLLESMPVVFRFQLEEETYGPLLKYIIDLGAVDEFKMFSKLIKDHNHNSISRLGYYDMLMRIRVNDEEMIRYACEYITIDDWKRTSKLRENYFLALCESDRKAQISDVLKNTNITEFASSKSISNILKSLGRLQLKSEAEKLLLDYSKDNDDWEDHDDISNFIASYAFSIPNLEVEHLIKEIENLHDLMNISPSSSTYEKLILYCCGKNKVDAAIYVVDKMCEAFCMPSSHVMQSVLETCSEINQDFQVDQIYSILSRHREYYFEYKKKICCLSLHFGAVMKDYYEEMQQSGIHFSKEVFVALIHAYAAYDEFEKAKQIVRDPRIPVKWLIEIKSMLVSSLASHGKLSEALVLLEEIKKAGQTLNPKANLCLMDVLCNLHGELERSLLLLTELSGEDWVQGCKIVIQFSVQNKNLSSTIEMFKQLMDYFKHGDKSDSVFDEVYYPILLYGSTHLQFGLDLLDLIKKELGLVPPSLCLDSLLCCCIKSGDLNNAHLVWREFAGDGYDPLNYALMYCALLALGDYKSADIIFKKLPSALFKKKVNAKDLRRLGTKVNAKVHQICAH